MPWYIQVEPLLGATTFMATFSARAQFGTIQQRDASAALSNLFPRPFESDAQYVPRVRSARLSAAAIWITIAGEQIYQACQAADQLPRVQPGPMVHEADGAFTSAKFTTWPQRFQELAGSSELDPRSVDLALQAVARMGDLSQGAV